MDRALRAIFFASVFLVFLTPMELGGFWWHLSSGKWIIGHLQIPREDPFSIAPQGGENVSFVLSAFWLCQALYAVIERLSGLWGMVALKASTFALLFYVLIRLGRGSLFAYAVSLPAVYAATFYAESRPQSFSFLFFALAVSLIEGGRRAYKEGGPPPRSFYALPLLMLLWANVHPGFVIGDALIGAYLAEAALAASAPGRERRRAASFAFISALSIGLSALNPNGLDAVLHTYRMLMTSIFGSPAIHEHLPVLAFEEFTGQRGLLPALVALMAAGAAGFALRWRRPDLVRIAVFAVLAALSLKTFRAGFFFAIYAAAVTGLNLSEFGTPSPLRSGKLKLLAAAAMVILAVAFLVPRTAVKKPLLAEGVFPDKAAAFIEAGGLPPNLYHPYEWGGYLMWRLYPEYKVFIDSRGIGPVGEHRAILNAAPGWEEALEKYGVNTVLFWPILPYRSDVPPIVLALQRDAGWSPVYWDTRSLIFVRSNLAGRPIPKSAVWEVLTSMLRARIAAAPRDASARASLGEVYMAMGLRPQAVEEMRKALALDPRNLKAARMLQALGQQP